MITEANSGDLIFELSGRFLVTRPVAEIEAWDTAIRPYAETFSMFKDPTRDIYYFIVTPIPEKRQECMLACAPLYNALMIQHR